ncbi:MAG: starch synthase [Candidatus Peregrinibacteria bacterium Greene1014_49]|nr:MAG: starch synthase [Candidatus Peregrinibacteria bacterium Greene1014_49]
MPSIWSPESDTHITAQYSQKTLDQKVRNKSALQKECGWPVEAKRAMVCLPLGMTEALGGQVFRSMLPGLFTQSMELLILGKGSKEYGTLFTELQKEHGHRIAILPASEASVHKILAASDIALFLANVESSPEVRACLSYGVIPVAPECDTLENYDPVQERGTGFLYAPAKNPEQTAWSAFAALARALETFKFPFDWKTIQRQCMESTK